DNTLVDSWATIHEALNHCMAAMGKPLWSLADTREKVRLSLREAFPVHFGERWEEAQTIYLNRFEAIHLDRLRPLPGRTELVEALAAEDIYLGIVSNKTGEFLRREVDRLGWSGYFGSIVGAGDASADKPAAAPVALALASSGIGPGETVWFVGDTAVDMECAHNSGCTPVLLGDSAADLEFLRHSPRFTFAEPGDLFRHVQGLAV
ncbi:MAG: HAD family hydrolase, partial [Stellaceae bacterium]